MKLKLPNNVADNLSSYLLQEIEQTLYDYESGVLPKGYHTLVWHPPTFEELYSEDYGSVEYRHSETRLYGLGGGVRIWSQYVGDNFHFDAEKWEFYRVKNRQDAEFVVQPGSYRPEIVPLRPRDVVEACEQWTGQSFPATEEGRNQALTVLASEGWYYVETHGLNAGYWTAVREDMLNVVEDYLQSLEEPEDSEE